MPESKVDVMAIGNKSWTKRKTQEVGHQKLLTIIFALNDGINTIITAFIISRNYNMFDITGKEKIVIQIYFFLFFYTITLINMHVTCTTRITELNF